MNFNEIYNDDVINWIEMNLNTKIQLTEIQIRHL